MIYDSTIQANSKKYGERCISGIVVEKSDRGHLNVLKDNNRLKWIRPISNLQHGEIPATLVNDIKILDIVKLKITQNCSNVTKQKMSFLNPIHLKLSL